MPSPLVTLTYVALVVMITATVLRVLKYARAPMHLRWELYPVPHEKGAAHGGSYFERPDWWTEPRETDLTAELRAMAEEMLLIRSLWRNNRPHWFASFPLHFGLYMLVTFAILLLVEGAVQPIVVGTPFWEPVAAVTAVVGLVGLFLATLGAILLLCRRAFEPELRSASAPTDYFNLAFLLAVFLAAWWAWITADASFAILRAYLTSLIAFRPSGNVAPPVAAEVAVASLFMLYMPFTHMMHFVSKYFTYHEVRWDDAPNRGEAGLQRRMAANLGRPVTWSAPHIQPDSTWAEAATEAK